MKQISEEKNIPMESVISTIEAALAVAYRKDFGEKNQNIKVSFDLETAASRVFDVKIVVADELKEVWDTQKAEEERLRAEAEAKGEEYVRPKKDEVPEGKPAPEAPTEVAEEEKEERYDPKLNISLTEAKALKEDAAIGDEIKTELFPPAAYGRMAAQTAKQVIIQRLREAERDMVFKEYKEREGDLINATVQRIEGRLVFVDLGHATAIMPPPEQIRDEVYNPSNRIKVYIVSVNSTSKGPEIIVSRSHPEIVRKLFTLEVPEIANGSVEIKMIAREAGHRTKLAVFSTQKNIDPIGSCVGQRGSRVQTVISELGGEKIDIIEWSDDSVQFIVNALSPAKIISVKLEEETRTATAEVKNDQLSLAIGKQGQNVRLSSKLTGWKINIVSEAGDATPQAETAQGAEPAEGEAPSESPASEPTEKPTDEQVETGQAPEVVIPGSNTGITKETEEQKQDEKSEPEANPKD